MINVDFHSLRDSAEPVIRYWFEHDSRNDLWIGRVTQNGEEVCVVTGATRQEVISSAESYRELLREAA